MYQKKEKGNIQKTSSGAPKTGLQKRTTRTVQKRSAEPVKSVENAKQQRLLHQKNQLEEKKKTEINTKKNLKQTRLLQKKDSPKRISRNVKTKPKTARNSKKSTLVPFTSEIVEERVSQDVITTNIPPPTAAVTVTNVTSRYMSQSTQTPINVSEISKTGSDENRRQLPLGTITTNISSHISKTGNYENRRQLPITAKISSKVYENSNKENTRQLPPGAIIYNKSRQIPKIGNKKYTRQLPPRTIVSNNSSRVSRNYNNENRRQLPPGTLISNIPLQISRNGNGENRRQLPAGTLISNTSPLDPDMRIITPSTAVAPAIVRNDEPSSSNIQFLTGFDRNLEPSEIIHIAEIDNEMFFMMKWKGTSKMDMVPAEMAKERCPQLVIQFYESRLRKVPHSSYS